MEFSDITKVLGITGDGNDSPCREESDSTERNGRWFKLRTKGNAIPSPRVGHSASFVTLANSKSDDSLSDNRLVDKIFCVGGANPSVTFQDAFALDLSRSTWEGLTSAKGAEARYEHSSAVVGQPLSPKLWIFGGANESGNLNDVREYDLVRDEWTTKRANDDQQCDSITPSPRTQHTSAVLNGNMLVVFGGGSNGPEPVDDQNLYLYDTEKCAWNCVKGSGSVPKSRQGHLILVANNKIYVHGGMSGSTFFDDLHRFDVDTATWSAVEYRSTCVPSARASHGGIVVGSSFYIFGGLTLQGAVNDLHSFNTENHEWSHFNTMENFPSPRLDFAFCAIPIVRRDKKDEECLPENSKESGSQFLFVHGGMDLSGNVFDDAYLCYLDNGI